MKLSIVVPVYNEEPNLRLLHQRLSAVAAGCGDDYEIVFVNDGSADGSLAIMKELAAADPHVRFVSFSRNFGHEMASSAGLDRSTGDAVVLIDADLQDPPELIPEMIAKWKSGVDVVYARRARRDGETAFKKATSWLFYRLLNKLTDVYIPPDTGDFRLMDRKVVDAVALCRENPRFVRGLVSWVGYRQDAIFYHRAERHAGETKYNVIKLIKLSWEAVCSFSLIPLRIMMWLGAIVTAISVGLTIHVAIAKIFRGITPQGYALLACGMFFLSGIQLIMLGFLAQYVGHIFRHTQKRPLYIIGEESQPSPTRVEPR